MPEISVIIPVYNTEKYLEKCLNGVLKQTFKDIEVICINDCSTDNSLSILEEYAAKDDRIKIINFDNNIGQGGARNRALDECKGSYAAFVDSDDECDENLLEELYRSIEKYQGKIDMAESGFYMRYEGDDIVVPFNRFKSKDGVPTGIFDKNFSPFDGDFGPVAKLFKVDFVKKNNIKFGNGRLAEDMIFVLKCRCRAGNIVQLQKNMYQYNRHSGSSTTFINYNAVNVIDIFKEVKEFLITENLYERYKDEFENCMIKGLLGAYKLLPEKQEKIFDAKLYTLLNKSQIKKLYKKINNKTFAESIFSLKNRIRNGYKYKALTIFGFEFLFNRKTVKTL